MTNGPVALFGATGRTGRRVLAEARRRGWPVRALVRDSGRLAAEVAAGGVQVLAGDARDSAAIDAVLQPAGAAPARAVLCALGMHDFSVPATDFSDSVAAIVAGLRRAGLRRFVGIASGSALDDPRGGYRGEHGEPEILKHVIAEHLRNHRTLRQAGDAWGLQWTLMCPLNLVDDLPPGHARRAFDALPPLQGAGETSMDDLAAAMCELLDDPAAVGRRVGIVSDRPGRAPA